MGMRRTIVRSVILAAVGATLLPATAAASRVEYVSLVPISNGMTITIKGKSGETNNVTVGLAQDFPNDWRITDSAGIVDPLPPGCVRESPTSIRCPRSGGITDPSLGPLEVASFSVILADGNDSFRPADGGIPEDIGLFVEAGEGNDVIIGHPGGGSEELLGGEGDDIIITGEPADQKSIDGGSGDDKIFVGAGEDPGQVMSAKNGKGAKGAEILGQAGRDKIVGSPQNDRISGGSGNDKLKGRGGSDKLICGGGKDTAIGGGGKDVARGCEKAKGI